jgi:methylase of polypeptide subunit release factors
VSNASLPLRIADSPTRAILREMFVESGFCERALRQRKDLEKLPFAGDSEFHALVDGIAADDPQTLLVRLFLSGHSVPAALFAARFDAQQRQALSDADLVRPASMGTAPSVYSPVILASVAPDSDADELFVAADRQVNVDGTRAQNPADIVFNGHNPLTRQFLSLLPTRALSSALDLCCGSGVTTLALGHRSGRAVGADVSARALHFARFNRWLNAAPHVEFTEGDLYSPIADERFEFICAHPPYVPTLRQTAVFRDGGALGDTIVQRFVAGVPDHLDAHGEFYLLCMGMDTEAASFEDRVRQWLGADGGAFDLVFAVDHAMGATEFADYIARRTSESHDQDRATWLDLLASQGVTQVLYGAIMGRRLPPGVVGETRRVKLENGSRAADFERVFDWLASSRAPQFGERLLNARMTLAAGGRLFVEHRVSDGEYAPDAVRLSNNGRPFPVQVNTEPWIAALLSTLHAHESLRAAVAAAREAGRLPSAFSDADALRIATYMGERGIIDIVEQT